jgi:hypothetical protein
LNAKNPSGVCWFFSIQNFSLSDPTIDFSERLGIEDVEAKLKPPHIGTAPEVSHKATEAV